MPKYSKIHPFNLRRYPTEMLMNEMRRRLADLQEDMDAIDYGQQVKAVRVRLKMTIEQFAEHIGYSKSSVSSAEQGYRSATAKKIVELMQNKMTLTNERKGDE